MGMIFGSNDDDDESEGESDESAGEPTSEASRIDGAEPVGGGEMPLGDEGERSTREVQDLETRLDDVEANIERTGASVRSIEEKQDNLSEEVNELNDRIRKLLGVYDQAAGDANPFADGSDSGQSGFGVIDDAPDDIDTGQQGSDHSEESGQEGSGDGVTEFEDLEAELESTQDSEPEQETEEFRETGDTTESSAPDETAHAPDDSQHLAEIPPTYAAEIIVMQWLSNLVRQSGQAGALKSFEYYESVGWISPSVRQHLEIVLSGPGIDAHVNPEDPSEPTSSDHLESYSYIKQLEELTEVQEWDSA